MPSQVQSYHYSHKMRITKNTLEGQNNIRLFIWQAWSDFLYRCYIETMYRDYICVQKTWWTYGCQPYGDNNNHSIYYIVRRQWLEKVLCSSVDSHISLFVSFSAAKINGNWNIYIYNRNIYNKIYFLWYNLSQPYSLWNTIIFSNNALIKINTSQFNALIRAVNAMVLVIKQEH